MTDDQKVEGVRSDIARIKEEINWTEKAPIPRAEAQVWISDQVEDLAALGKGFVRIASYAVTKKDKGCHGIADLLAASSVINDLDPIRRCVSIMVSMFEDQVKAKLLAALDAHDYEAGLPQSERPKRLRDLKIQLFELECREEALIEDAEERGMQIMRRADADPVAVLDYNPDGDAYIKAESSFTPRMAGETSPSSDDATSSVGSNQPVARAAASADYPFPISPAAVGIHGTGAPRDGSDSWQPDLPAPGSSL